MSNACNQVVDTFRRQYRIHGLRTAITSSRLEILEAIDRRLRHFAFPFPETPLLYLDYRVVPDTGSHLVAAADGPTRTLFTMTADGLPFDVQYRHTDDLLYMSCGEAIRALVDGRHGATIVSVARDHATRIWLLSHPLLTLALLEGLRRHGLYGVHAAAMSAGGKGLLLAGGSGAGKSTLALALARAGLAFLGDDTVLLNGGGRHVKVLAFPDELDISPRTAAFFPELYRLAHTPPPPGRRKHGVFIDEICPVEFVDQCTPAVIVVPRVADAPTSVLREANPEDVFIDLVPNVILTHPATAQGHLDAIAGLLAQARCYRLDTGRDLDAVAGRLRNLLELA